jgi:hypothetical protein
MNIAERDDKNILSMIIQLRLDNECKEQVNLMVEKTGLSKSYIMRRCCAYALPKFTNHEVDILTLKDLAPKEGV